MSAATDDGLAIYRGAALERTYQWQRDGVDVNITGATFEATAKLTYSDVSALFTFTVTIVDAATGKFKIALTGTETAAAAAPTLNSTQDSDSKAFVKIVFNINVTLGGVKTQVVRGTGKYYPST